MHSCVSTPLKRPNSSSIVSIRYIFDWHLSHFMLSHASFIALSIRLFRADGGFTHTYKPSLIDTFKNPSAVVSSKFLSHFLQINMTICFVKRFILFWKNYFSSFSLFMPFSIFCAPVEAIECGQLFVRQIGRWATGRQRQWCFLYFYFLPNSYFSN